MSVLLLSVLLAWVAAVLGRRISHHVWENSVAPTPLLRPGERHACFTSTVSSRGQVIFRFGKGANDPAVQPFDSRRSLYLGGGVAPCCESSVWPRGPVERRRHVAGDTLMDGATSAPAAIQFAACQARDSCETNGRKCSTTAAQNTQGGRAKHASGTTCSVNRHDRGRRTVWAAKREISVGNVTTGADDPGCEMIDDGTGTGCSLEVCRECGGYCECTENMECQLAWTDPDVCAEDCDHCTCMQHVLGECGYDADSDNSMQAVGTPVPDTIPVDHLSVHSRTSALAEEVLSGGNVEDREQGQSAQHVLGGCSYDTDSDNSMQAVGTPEPETTPVDHPSVRSHTSAPAEEVLSGGNVADRGQGKNAQLGESSARSCRKQGGYVAPESVDDPGCHMVTSADAKPSTITCCKRSGGRCICDFAQRTCLMLNMRGPNSGLDCRNSWCEPLGERCTQHDGPPSWGETASQPFRFSQTELGKRRKAGLNEPLWVKHRSEPSQ